MPTFFNRDQYDEDVRASITLIFSGQSISQLAGDQLSRLFIKLDWVTVGLPLEVQRSFVEQPSGQVDRTQTADAWIPFFDTLRHFGEKDLIIAATPSAYPGWMPAFGPKRNTPNETQALAAACRFDRQEFLAAEREARFMTYSEFLVFGRQPIWGMVSHWQCFSILGGTGGFIGDYVKRAGGIEKVRKRFEIGLEQSLRTEKGETVEDRFADLVPRSMRWPE